MKALLVLALSSLCATAMADEVPTDVAQQQPVIEEYTYSTHLDIAKVVSMSEVPNVCEVVPAKMEYDDSKGQRHILRRRHRSKKKKRGETRRASCKGCHQSSARPSVHGRCRASTGSSDARKASTARV